MDRAFVLIVVRGPWSVKVGALKLYRRPFYMGNLRWNGFCFGDVGNVWIVGVVGKVAGIKLMKPAILYRDMDRVICADRGPWSVKVGA